MFEKRERASSHFLKQTQKVKTLINLPDYCPIIARLLPDYYPIITRLLHRPLFEYEP